METVPCMNKCGAQVIRSKVKAHEETECPNAQLPCILAEIGCTWVGDRFKMDDHLNSNCKYGFAKQMYIYFKQKINDLEHTVTKLKAEIAGDAPLQKQIQKYVFCSTDKTVQVWDIDQGKLVNVITGFDDHVTCMLVTSM